MPRVDQTTLGVVAMSAQFTTIWGLPLLITFIIGGLIEIWLVRRLIKLREHVESYGFSGFKRKLLYQPVVLFLSYVVTTLASFIFANGLYKKIPDLIESKWLATVLFAASVFLFYLKKRVQLLYGLIEVSAASGVMTFISFTQQATMGQRIVSGATAVYFFIRGLDNLSQAPTIRRMFKLDEDKKG